MRGLKLSSEGWLGPKPKLCKSAHAYKPLATYPLVHSPDIT